MRLLLTPLAGVILATAAAADGPTPPRIDPPVLAPPGGTPDIWTGGFLRLSYGAQERTAERENLTTITETPLSETPETDACHYTSGHSGGAKCDMDADHVVHAFGHLEHCRRRYVETCIVGNNPKNGTVRVWVPGAQIGDTYTYETGNIITTYGEPVTTTISRMVPETYSESTVGLSAVYRHNLGTLVIGGEGGTRHTLDSDNVMTYGELQAGIDLGRALPYLAVGYAGNDDASGMIYSIGADLALSHKWIAGLKAYTTDFDVKGLEASIAMRF